MSNTSEKFSCLCWNSSRWHRNPTLSMWICVSAASLWVCLEKRGDYTHKTRLTMMSASNQAEIGVYRDGSLWSKHLWLFDHFILAPKAGAMFVHYIYSPVIVKNSTYFVAQSTCTLPGPSCFLIWCVRYHRFQLYPVSWDASLTVSQSVIHIIMDWFAKR